MNHRIVIAGLVIPLCAVLCLLPLQAEGAEGQLWLEAESFDTLGGWFVYQQSMDQMGSAYVMAHGMGVPVADAETACNIPKGGEWTVWARTRDWTAPWRRGTPGGTFRVAVNGYVLPETLGTNGAAWGWQKAGTVALDEGEIVVALRDLTGFNGRCDALYLTLDANAQPPNSEEELAAFRKAVAKPGYVDDPVVYDLAVAGGGMSGICTAISAIRTGSTVVLIQDRPVLGGNNSSEIRVPLGGRIHVFPYSKLGNVVQEIAPITGRPGVFPAEYYEDQRKENIFRTCHPKKYRLVMNTRVIGVEKDKDDPMKITAYIARNVHTGAETRFRAKLFADCTGDAVIARMMGAEVMYGRESRDTYNESLAPVEGDNQVMGMSVIWRSKKAAEPTPFPDIDWGLEITEDNVYYVRSGDWEWETGQYRNQAEETEYIRDYGMMTIFANWSFLKNHSERKAEWARDTLSWISPLGGKRESYRVVGDYVLNQNDIENHVIYPDATASTTWNLDLHFPDPEHIKKFEEPFRSCAYHRNLVKPYPLPYRCLYSKDVTNLFLAGRHISTSHVAFGSVRVMRTLGLLGEVVGMAASICAKEGVYPRDVYESHFDKLKAMMERGVPAANTYHTGGGGSKYEGYHFKDTGHLGVYPHPHAKLNDPEVRERIEALGVQHLADEDQKKSTDTPHHDGSHGLERFFDGWVDASPEDTTVVTPDDGDEHASGWTYRGHLPSSDGPSIIGGRVWEASGSNVPTLVTTIRGLKPGTVYDVAALFIGIDPERKDMNWEIDAGFAPQELTSYTISSEGVLATGNVTTTGTGVQLLAPVGKRTADAMGEIRVYLNTSDYGPHSRSRYDGLGYKVCENP